MSTPTEGPGRWEQGNWGEAMGALANMDESQQRLFNKWMSMTPEQEAKLDKVLNKEPSRKKIHDAIGRVVARVHEVRDQTAARLSEAAQTLATQAREYRQAVVGGANLAAQGAAQAYRDVRDPVVDGYNRASEQVADLVDRGAVAVDAAAQWASDRADAVGRAVVDTTVEAGRRIGQGAEAVGRGAQVVADGAVAAGGAAVNGVVRGAQATGRGAVAAGTAVVEAGQRAAGRVSRWIQGGQDFAQRRAESVRASVAMMRWDASQPALTTADIVEVAHHFNEVAAESTVEGRDRVWAELRAATEAKIAAAQGSTQGAAPGADAAKAQSLALGGMAQAGGPVPAQTTGPAQGNNEQGAQTNVNLTKNNNTKGTGLGG
jgi:hypothetical protein